MIFIHIDRGNGEKEALNLDDITRVYASTGPSDAYSYSFVQLRHSGVVLISYNDAVAIIKTIQDL